MQAWLFTVVTPAQISRHFFALWSNARLKFSETLEQTEFEH